MTGRIALAAEAAVRAGAEPVPTRVSFRFSAGGGRAACLVRPGGGPITVESWSLGRSLGQVPQHRPLPTALADLPPTQPVPLEDGRVLLLRCGSGVHRLSLLAPGRPERTLGEHRLAGLRLLPCPGDGPLAVAVGTGVDGRAQLWPVTESGLAPAPLATLPGVLAGGSWLDTEGRWLVLNQATGSRVRAVALDLRTGVRSPLPDADDGPVRVLLAAPESGLLICLVTGPDRVGLGWSTVDDPAAVRRPPVLAGLSPARAVPVAADRAGRRVAFQLDDAVRSRLAVFSPADGRLSDVPIPPGCLGGVADWSGELLRAPFSAPASPTALAELRPEAPESFRLHGSTPAGSGRDWVDARVERFAGPAGPVEALVYGDWRRARRLVLALHGGPDSAWRLCFEPLLQQLAGCGMAVVAPNQRGSTGYGDAHRRAIRAAWGGPDAEDIRHLARHLRAERGGRRMSLYGISYGAFLALLVAGTEPRAWSRCAVVAPFLSGQRLHAEAGLRVRALVDRLDGRIGPHDVLRVADRIRARLLVVHGSADPIIPVSQSRALAEHLHSLGRREPDFSYLEVPGGGHDPLTGSGAGDQVIRRLCGFLDEEDR